MSWRWAIPILGSLAMLAATAHDAAASDPLAALDAPAPVGAQASDAADAPTGSTAATATQLVDATVAPPAGVPGDAVPTPVAPLVEPIAPAVAPVMPVITHVTHAVAPAAAPVVGPASDAAGEIASPVLAPITEPVTSLLTPVLEPVAEPIIRPATGLIRPLEPLAQRDTRPGATGHDRLPIRAAAPGLAGLDATATTPASAVPSADATSALAASEATTSVSASGDGPSAVFGHGPDSVTTGRAILSATVPATSASALGGSLTTSGTGSLLVGLLAGFVMAAFAAFRRIEVPESLRRFGLAPVPLVPPG